MREVINHSTRNHLLNTTKSTLTQTLENTLQEESSQNYSTNTISIKNYEI